MFNTTRQSLNNLCEGDNEKASKSMLMRSEADRQYIYEESTLTPEQLKTRHGRRILNAVRSVMLTGFMSR
ncbi:hypothetical protein ABKN59_010266 [Abortiporus biennis]